MINKKLISQKNPKSKNITFITSQELKQKVQQRKVQFAQLNIKKQKSKTLMKKERQSPAFNKISSKPQKNVKEIMKLRSSVKQATISQKSINFLTERFLNPEKIFKTINTKDDNDLQKQRSSSNNKIHENHVIWKKIAKKVEQINEMNIVKTVADNFLSSFRIIFKEILESYFLQIFLKKQTSYLASEIWIHILKNTDLQQLSKKEIIQQNQIETKKLLFSIHLLLKKEFTMSQIQNMASKYFPQKNKLVFEDFNKLFSFQNDFIDFLVEKSFDKKYKQWSPTQLVNQLFKLLIETADLQKKIRMICRANEDQLIKFIISISSGPMLKIPNLATFLDGNHKQNSFGMKLTQAKLIKFLNKKLSKKHTKYEFMKWLKIDDKLLR